MKKTTFIFTLFAFIIVINCSKARENISYMYNLKEAISDNYDTDDIKINITNKNEIEELNISISDSKFNSYSSKKKQIIANEIGKIASKLRENKIITGKLIFIDESNYGIVKTSKTDSYKINCKKRLIIN
ncbi:hypothetical protein [Thalassobellus citreus]|uniref:hypothetical protein n=1 Tax=Thalassobellus citreus TaxID=3367752 RepID=UPI003787513F